MDAPTVLPDNPASTIPHTTEFQSGINRTEIFAADVLEPYQFRLVADQFDRSDITSVSQDSNNVFQQYDLLVPTPRVYQYLKDGQTSAGKPRQQSQVLELNEFFVADDPKFIVHNEDGRKFLVFDSYADFKSWFAVNDIQTLHEVVRGSQPQRLKFDIDCEADKLDALEDMSEPDWSNYEWWNSASPRTRKSRRLFDTIAGAIIECFADLYSIGLGIEQDFTISDSTDATKFSRHIVITRFHVKNNEEAKFFTRYLLTLLPENIRKLLDPGVNKTTQNFRLPGCHKVGSSRIKRVFQGAEDSMLITQVGNTRALPALNIRAEKSFNLITGVDEAAVIKMAEPYADGLIFRNRKNNLFCYKRERPGHCQICERCHDADNTLYVSVSKGGYVRAHCFHGKGSIEIGRVAFEEEEAKKERKPLQYGVEIVPSDFKPFAKVPAQFRIERFNEQYLHMCDFHEDRYDTLLIKANMGTGKTKQLLEYIKSLPEQIRIIVVSFRRSFTTEIKGKLGDTFVDYREEKGQICAVRVVIQFESLHRLSLPVGQQCLLVLDESESVIGQMENRQMSTAGTLRSCWENFQWLVTNATKLIAMDAFADFRTYALLSYARKSVHMQLNTYTLANVGTDFYYHDRDSFLAAVYKEAPNARKSPFVVISTGKKQAIVIEGRIRKLCPRARVRSYNSDSTAEDRKDFENVNNAWKNVDVLIYTSTISAGCSFELPRFKKMFAYFSDKSVDYKTSIQMMGRVRDIASREYHIFAKCTPSDLPNSVREVEKAIAQKAEICNMETNPLNMPKFINASGEKEYALKDLYYHLHVGNIVHRCQSRNRFRWLFQQHRATMGVKLMWAEKSELSEDKIETLRIEHNKALKELTQDENQRIAAAPAVDDEEAYRLANIDLPTREQKEILIARRLTECYHVSQEEITCDFVKTYNKPKVMQIFRNLERITPNESIADTVTKWRQTRAQNKVKSQESIDDLNESTNLMKCMFAVDILNALLSDPGQEYCRAVGRFRTKEVERAVLEQRIDKVVDDLRAKVDVVSLTFGIRKDILLKKRAKLKQKLELVNSILSATFDIKIAAVGRTGVRTNFELAESDLFQWCDELGKYIVQTNKAESATVDLDSS